MRNLRCCSVLLALAAAALATPLRAQESWGSFGTTAAFSAGGAALGFTAAALLAQRGSSMCPAVPGAECRSSGVPIVAALGASLAGSAAGAMLGRHLTGGRQSLPRSLVGAGIGLLIGGVVLAQIHTDQPVPVVLSVTIPQGLFAALVGW